MAKRRPDVIRVDTENGSFDAFERIEVVNDIFGPAEASFDIGVSRRAWREIGQFIRPGQLFDVYVNDRLRLRGRAEANEVHSSTNGGTTARLTVRTKLMDARYASADPATKVSKTSIRDFILALYKPLGFKDKDFVFDPAVARDLMTGKAKGGKAPVDLAPLQADQAKVQPPESIFDAAARHLDRHHLIQWDAGDGRIVIGSPDKFAPSLYLLSARRGAASVANSICSFERVIDWSEVPSSLTVYGGTPGKDLARASLRYSVVDGQLYGANLRTGHFHRPVLIPAEGVKTIAQAADKASREYAQRVRRKDAWEITTDGWSFWNGTESITWAINTAAELDIDTLGGPAGRYLITRVAMTASLDEKATTLTLSSPECFAPFDEGIVVAAPTVRAAVKAIKQGSTERRGGVSSGPGRQGEP
jgi:prophage tail gpP-like protein